MQIKKVAGGASDQRSGEGICTVGSTKMYLCSERYVNMLTQLIQFLLKDVNFFFVQMKRDDEQYKIYSYIQTSLHKMRSN